MRIWSVPAGLVIVALASAFALGCGDDGDNGNGATPPEATEAPANNGGEPGDLPTGGSATLTIGGEMWTFDEVYCAFSADESGSPALSFFVNAFGEAADGTSIQLDASIIDGEAQGRYEGPGVTHVVALDDIEDFQNPSVAWSAIGGIGNDEAIIQVDGRTVRAEAVFDDYTTGGEFEQVTGTLEANCP